MSSLLISGGTIIRVNGEEKADILIQNGDISLVDSEGSADQTIDASGLLIFPGLIDCHVHFREPGLTHKATMKSEARAARAGGVTTVCEMPNTSPPTFTAGALADKVRLAQEVTDCDIRFFMGAVAREHLAQLRTVWASLLPEMQRLKARCCGLKLFLENSTGDLKTDQDLVEEAFRLCAEIDCPIVAHCEDPVLNASANAAISDQDIATHSLRRPPESEAASIEHATTLARRYGTRLHIAHLSAALGLEVVRRAKEEGLAVTCEVTPHHLLLDTSRYEDLGVFAKMNPPLRSSEDSAALWQGIADGVIDCIATDHAPHLKEEKEAGSPLSAPSGVPGVETMLPLLLTVAATGKLSYSDIVRLCFDNPNTIYSLGKEHIADGADADILIVDPKEEWEIHAVSLHSLCGWTPFEGAKVRGRVKYVLRKVGGYAVDTQGLTNRASRGVV
ncbi:hypothetical protein A2454_02005 [Candidatus Peribacteria bacterium RIFOXYC2_FULL_55_14]|nr:MAG: Dihydroorotase [Candidatus Peribacteria bacterium GW2011_GWC2_54_8]OGJ72446.1 MAG: hypothetical protein A2198_06635 [Candidatus Peribacteria bacterium RIFOXYA1_FULL_56_14]OGJ73495.1 MAG: hypothetical protein A2217_02190 [Candidatus Peribacteria bacterium RIFOXYA2_FULL_55_28]OGJ74676.1 MAG: hypothetical protein A2384_03475 [Candidatus Peribacteria bacterium RIFOXYB1_FULL_54_35]OGJ76841.1 MAG: hypothetical protein A2327_06965 [Candidatus Peribacteria bacterium RIFOXYB2_FULL_54_17]OGJ7806